MILVLLGAEHPTNFCLSIFDVISLKVSQITSISLVSQHALLTSCSHHRFGPKKQWPCCWMVATFSVLATSAPLLFYQRGLMVIWHHPHYHYHLVMLLILWQQQHTSSSCHILMLLFQHSGTASEMLIIRSQLHLTAQNWPKCKIHCKNGGWGAVLIISLLQHKLSMSTAVRGRVCQSTSKQLIEARRYEIKSSNYT